MIAFNSIHDDNPALAHSPMLKAALLTLDYIEANGPIGLTPLRALKRYFVTWAAEAFAWPHYTAAELYDMNKVLNEPDFPPLVGLHDLLLSAKLMRHYKGAAHLTKKGRQLKSHPAVLWMVLAHHLLCVVDHGHDARYYDRFDGDWEMLLREINAEAEVGVTEERLCAALFGFSEKDMLRDHLFTSAIYHHVLRPLCWTGLLDEQRQGKGLDRTRLFVKTSLWFAALPVASAKQATFHTRH